MEGCGAPERSDFYQFLLLVGVVVLKEEIFNSSALGICGGLKITDFVTVLLWEGVLVLKIRDY